MGYGLYDSQIEAIKKIRNGSILNGDVGSGKSRTAIGYYYLRNGGDIRSLGFSDETKRMHRKPKDLYIITTATKRDKNEWASDLAPFCLSADKECNLYKNTVTIDSWNNIKKYRKVYDAFFIFDEDHVTGSGAWVKAFYDIARKNEWIILSATPGDCWMDYAPVFVANKFFRNKTEFIKHHVIYSRFSKYPKIDRYIDEGILIRYRNAILVEMKVEKPTVRHHEDVYVDYDKILYKDIIKNRWNPYTNKPIKNASEFCYTLRKVVNSDQSRQKALLELAEDNPRIIVFYNYDYERDILLSMYFGDNVTVAEWNGWEHQPVPTTKRWVYLVQYTSGCEGWNCITTNVVVFYSQNYAYKVLSQACGRIDRLNTKYVDLYYYHFKSRSGIDLSISRALINKKKFNEGKFYERF